MTDKLFCTYHNTSAPIDDFCCPWNIQNIALHFQGRAQELTKQLAELRENISYNDTRIRIANLEKLRRDIFSILVQDSSGLTKEKAHELSKDIINWIGRKG